MNCNKIYQEARTLTYVEIPTKFVWKLEERRWDRREKGFSIGRIHSVSPTLGETYYLRILLNKVKSPKSFEDIRTVNGNIFPTFRDACYALGLLDDDKKYIDAIEEANLTGSDLSLNEEQVKNLTLFEIEKILLRNNSSLRKLPTMPYPDNDSLESSNNRFITKDLDYSIGVYDDIMTTVENNRSGVFFVYGQGGIGEGKVGSDNDGEAIVDIPHDLLITDSMDHISTLIQFVYPSILVNIKNSSYFQEREILAPKHEVVQEINDRLLSLFAEDEKEYLCLDSLCESEQLHDQFDKTLYSPDVLNGLNLPRLPNHKILLKVGVPIMLLRNIDQKSGLCNGTRLRVLSLEIRLYKQRLYLEAILEAGHLFQESL
ncbi:uncharacterized protein LOC112502897 [Cynara cardunculus var. scolymus]|uniref:uncharacterized protein LOC112502897 n=1 Tax=Cynara cardunculus var. scolymus TaxID=59895 RepID=UPI000D62A757|nr:uncharacterized protein LOC112502897 [Cynara cardunculus var. scolymus]